MEGNIGEQNTAFFESPGFRTFNFALLERLSTIQHTTLGFAELDLRSYDTQKKLKTSLKKLDTVVESLQQLLEISKAFNSASVQTIHPETILEDLFRENSWPKVEIKTYQSLLVIIPLKTFVTLLAQMFAIEQISLNNFSVGFRRRQSNVIMRITTPKTHWLRTNLEKILRQNDVCLPMQSDSLDVILLRAIVCVLHNYHIQLSINRRQPECIYFYLPSARQMQVFAQEDIAV